MKERMRDFELPEDKIFNPSDGAGLKVLDGERIFYTSFEKRELDFEVTDFLGSFNAEHYYGTIVLKARDLVKNKKDTCRTFLAWVKLPEEAAGVELELTHKLTKKEAIYLNKKDSSYGFMKLKPGDYDGRFETVKEIIDKAFVVIKKHFPDFKVNYEGSEKEYFNKVFGVKP